MNREVYVDGLRYECLQEAIEKLGLKGPWFFTAKMIMRKNGYIQTHLDKEYRYFEKKGVYI